jgi:hypothetical protein
MLFLLPFLGGGGGDDLLGFGGGDIAVLSGGDLLLGTLLSEVLRLLAAFFGDAFLGDALAGPFSFCGVALPPPLVCARAILGIA